MPAGFQGRWILPGGERFLDFRFRTYDTAWGRFLQPDPLGHPDGRSNRYQFGGNDPFRSDPFGLFDDGELNDDKGKWTHVGITKAANEVGSGLLSDEALKVVYTTNWEMDNREFVAGLGSPNNILFHDLGTETGLRLMADWVWTTVMEDNCSLELLGGWLHRVQDRVAHRDPKGNPYEWKKGHAGATGLSWIGRDFNPDMINPEEMSWWTRKMNERWKDLQARRVREAIAETRTEINKYLDRCGQSGHDGLFAEEGRAQPVEDTTKSKGPTSGSGESAGGGAGANREGAKPAAAAPASGSGGNRALTGRGTQSASSGPASGAGGQMQPVTPRPHRNLTGTGKGMCLPDCEGPPPPAPPPAVDPAPTPPTSGGTGALTGRGGRGGR